MRAALPTDRHDAIDVSKLPTYAFGHRGLLWWGTLGMIVIEAMAFALLIVTYLYLRGRSNEWPLGARPPGLVWGTANLVLLVVSAVPNELAKKAAERLDLPKVRLWEIVCLVFAAGFVFVRIQEFHSLNIWWDTNAYGSLVWTLLALHTVHIVTDFIESAALAVLLYVGPLDESRFTDVTDGAIYWYFVIAAWIPIYAVIYLAPRMW